MRSSALSAAQWRHNESCAVTTGLLGLTPSADEFKRALGHLYSMGNKVRPQQSRAAARR